MSIYNTEILISESFEGGDERASSRGQSRIGELVLWKVRIFVVFGSLEFVAVLVFELKGKVLLVKILLGLLLGVQFDCGV